MNSSDIDAAVAVLRRGGLVAFPTETVYGLGADAGNPAAVAKIFAAKGRPADHPVIVHLAHADQIADWSSEVTSVAATLARAFWPGPMTLVMRRAPGVSEVVTGGQDTVGLRVPSNPVAHALLERFGGGIAAPSANRFGRVSATTAQHVRQELGNSVEMVLDGGACEVGIESAIIDVTGNQPVLLRPGRISVADIARATGLQVAAAGTHAPRASGTLAAHYAPRTPLQIVRAGDVAACATRVQTQGLAVAVLALQTSHIAQAVWVSAPCDAAGYAHDLYANLRALDAAGCALIIVEQPPQATEWDAVNDRLGRAAVGSQASSAP